MKQALTSLSDFSLFKASIAAISLMDSSTFPCSPVAHRQYAKNAKEHQNSAPRVSIFSVPPWMANSISAISRIKLVVFAFSSGVFSNLLCADRILRSHSSTKANMLDSYSVWKRLNNGLEGSCSLAVAKSVLSRSVWDLGHAPKSIF